MPLTPEQVAAMTKAGAAPTAKGPETPKQEKVRRDGGWGFTLRSPDLSPALSWMQPPSTSVHGVS